MFFPRRCPFCDRVVGGAYTIPCRDCENKVPYIYGNTCMKCGKKLSEEEEEYCFDCKSREFSFSRGVAAFSYSKAMKKSMYAFKYNNRQEYAEFYAKVLCNNFGNTIRSFQADMIVPIPLFPAKERKRGYNQAEILAVRIGQELKIPVNSGIIKRKINTKPQKEVSFVTRNNNVKNAFQIENDSVKCKNILLVDDIYTTGATMESCAGILKKAGANEVFFAAACIGKGF